MLTKTGGRGQTQRNYKCVYVPVFKNPTQIIAVSVKTAMHPPRHFERTKGGTKQARGARFLSGPDLHAPSDCSIA